MNSSKFYFDVYKRFVNIPQINNLVMLEINTTGKLSSDMWPQLFGTIYVESDANKLFRHTFDLCYFNIDDFSNIGTIVKSMNLQKRDHGVNYFLFSSKTSFWVYSNQLLGDAVLQQDGRRFYSIADLGLTPYKIKTSNQTIIHEVLEPEATLFEYR